MTSIGFTVRVYDNFRTKGVLEKIEKYATNEEMGKCNAFGLAFLSHGHENGDLATFDGMTNVKAIIGQVKGSTLLAGKPKLFFFQGQFLIKIHLLRVVQTQAILLLKSMSERVGSDMKRLWILNNNSYLYRLKID